MNIILSRKGFDSSAGQIPSIILPDGRLFSFPIPDKKGNVKYSAIKSPIPEYRNLFELLSDLYKGKKKEKFNEKHLCHLDPDINPESIDRPQYWKPLFGQISAAQSHLMSRKVGVGDIFLYFGWFRQTEYYGDKIRYVPGSTDRHIIYGYLVVGDMININNPENKVDEWMKRHVHFHLREDCKLNSLYVSADHFNLNGISYPGSGIFKYHDKLVLTKTGQPNRSLWELPKAFFPFKNNRTPLSCHEKPKRWELKNDCVQLQSVGRGQEFIIDIIEYPELESWVNTIISTLGK